MKRDPRINPKAGDKLRSSVGLWNGKYKTITVLAVYDNGDPSVGCRRGGRELMWRESIETWRVWAKGAHVIRAAE